MKRRLDNNARRGGTPQDKYAHRLHNAPSTNAKVTTVTVTRPHHPLTGQKFILISAGQYWLTVKSTDGSRRRIRPEWTNHDDLADSATKSEPEHLFTVEGLRQIISILGL